MSELVDNSQYELSAGARWLRRSGFALGLLAIVGLIVWGAVSLGHSSAPARQVAKITLLPDQPPPPPPPPPPDKPKIEPKTEMKQQEQKIKQEMPPEPPQLKMSGQAGEGPSPFAAGEVKNDYIGGDIGNGDRYAAYVGHVAQFLQDKLTHCGVKIAAAQVFLWEDPDGKVQRYEINGVSGTAEKQLRACMADLERIPEAPPQDMPVPMGLEISGR